MSVVSTAARRRRAAAFIGAAVGLVVALASYLGALEPLERRSADLRMALRGSTTVDGRVTILAIDEASIAALGQFPWPRSVHAAAIDTLYALGAQAVVLDVLFVEPDRNGAAHDALLAESLAEHDGTVLASFFEHVIDGRLNSLVSPLAMLAEHARTGHANLTPDADGVLREIPVAVEHRGAEVPSLALASLAAMRGESAASVLAALPPRVRGSGRVRLNFPGAPGAFPTISYAALLGGEVPRRAVEGRAVIVGGTASGLFDTAAVPGQPVQHGVEIHATALDNLLRGTDLRTPAGSWIALALVALGLARGVTLARGRAFAQALLTATFLGAYVALSVAALERLAVVLPLVGVVLVLLGAHMVVVLWRLAIEERERRWIDRMFGQYLSPKVIAALKADPRRLRLGGEDRELTVMFVDLAGFTAASARLDPECLARLLNEFLSEMSDVVLAHDGVIDKFLGDGIMVFWNAPLEQPGHAGRACRSALAQLERFDALRARWAGQGLPPMDCRIGIATGRAKVGNFGSRHRFDYTAIGESVNLAARLEAANKVTATRCLVCARTREGAGSGFTTSEVGELVLPGFDAPVRAFALEAGSPPVRSDEHLDVARPAQGAAAPAIPT